MKWVLPAALLALALGMSSTSSYGSGIVELMTRVDHLEKAIEELETGGAEPTDISHLESLPAKVKALTARVAAGESQLASYPGKFKSLTDQLSAVDGQNVSAPPPDLSFYDESILELAAKIDALQLELDKMNSQLGNVAVRQEEAAVLDAEQAAAHVSEEAFEEEAAEALVSTSGGVDFVNRYVWRGLDIGSAPSVQPYLSVITGGLEVGFWGAYASGNNAEDLDETDIWAGYTHSWQNGVSLTGLVTDYYFPNAGVKWGNFNNHDDPDGAGAHTFELGLSFTGPEVFPLTVSAFSNVYNDAGNNSYFQADWPISTNGTDMTLFLGATPGSNKNPGWYGSEEFAVINLGMAASREIEMSSSFSLPVSVSYVLNPRAEKSFLVFGFGL